MYTKSRQNPVCFSTIFHIAMGCFCFWDSLAGQDAGSFSSELLRWELSDYSKASYESGVDALLKNFESRTGQLLRPGELKKVGLKVYTASGAGLATPKNLVEGVIGQLRRRGFESDQIFLLDQNERNLRAAGYLPPLSQRRSDYEGIPVYALESDSLTHPDWFYESPLPSFPLGGSNGEDDRKSFLPYPLVAEVDFWINLPVVVDCPGVEISGSLTNVSIWNVLNHQRFLADKSSTPVATTEIAAIPELKQKCILTLLSLERYQYIGGPSFHSLYTASDPELCLASNMVLLDYYMTLKMNELRRLHRFKEIPLDSPIFQYGKTLGLGDYEPETTRIIKVN
jgi:hypothetical protein